MPCGTYVSQFVLQALYVGSSAHDYGESALQVMTSNAKNSWLHMLAQGATTTMEMWTPDEKPNLTWSHVWSASPGFIIPWYLFGIQCLAPGWSKISIKPAPGSLQSGEYSLPTIRGTVQCRFSHRKELGVHKFELSVTIPLGMEARVSLPRLPGLSSAGSTLQDSKGHIIADTEIESGYVVAPSVGPGMHTFTLV